MRPILRASDRNPPGHPYVRPATSGAGLRKQDDAAGHAPKLPGHILGVSGLALVMVLTGCLGMSRAPTEPAGVRILRGWTFATYDGNALQLDLYLPENYQQPLPIIVWLHGGGWMFGSRNGCPLAPLALRGYAVASVSYRLSGFTSPVEFPAQLHDCQAAVRWLRHNAWRFGCAGERIGVVGVSAGAHLAALLGTTAGDVDLDGDLGGTGISSRVQAVVALFPPTDLLALEQDDEDHWGLKLVALGLLDGQPSERPQLARSASPALRAKPDCPPFLIFHGRDDAMIPVDQSKRLHAALQAAGVPSTLVIYDHLSHSDEALDRPELQTSMYGFLDELLHPAMATVDPARP